MRDTREAFSPVFGARLLFFARVRVCVTGKTIFVAFLKQTDASVHVYTHKFRDSPVFPLHRYYIKRESFHPEIRPFLFSILSANAQKERKRTSTKPAVYRCAVIRKLVRAGATPEVRSFDSTRAEGRSRQGSTPS